jgi:hypothetical protein
MSRDGGGVAARIALTLLVAVGAPLLARIPLPGVDVTSLQLVSFDRAIMGIFALELHPFLSAALLVEVLALVVPRWRAWRLGGYLERDHLWRRVAAVALLLLTVQAFFVIRWMMHSERVFDPLSLTGWAPHTPLAFMAVLVTLVGGSFLLYWLTRLIDSRGAGNGFSVMLMAFLAPPTLAELISSARHRLDGGAPILFPLAAAAVAVAAVTRLAGGGSLRPHVVPNGREQLPTPASGLYPLGASQSLLNIPAQLAVLEVIALPPALTAGTWTYRAAQIALIAGLGTLTTWMFNRPRVVAQAWREADGVGTAFARSLALSVVVCWGLAAVEWLCADAKLAVSVVNLAVLACVAADVVGELRFRQRHGALARVWPVHRLYVLQSMLSALAAAGIPAFPRGRRHRTLWNFLAPFVPVDILVPVEQADRARTIVLPLSGSEVHSPAHEA